MVLETRADELRPASARASAPGSARRCRERNGRIFEELTRTGGVDALRRAGIAKVLSLGDKGEDLRGACWAPVLPNYEDLSARQQNGVDHVDDAVRLVHVADGDLSRAAFGVPDPQLAVLLPEGQVGALDGLEHGLAVAGLDLFHQ